MKCGIVGLPNVGKSTIFNCISKNKVPSENFPFCTIKPNISIIKIPDKRILKLKKLVKTKKIIPAVIKIVDIAGLIKNAHKGEGLGNKFLSKIREMDVIIHVIRFFEDKNIIHVENSLDPIRDKEIVDLELQLKDLEFLEKKIKKENNNNLLKIEKKILKYLKNGKNVRDIFFYEEEKKKVKKLNFLTYKPVLYLCNIGNNKKNNILLKKFINYIYKKNENILYFCAKENKKSNINKLIKSSYNLLNLQNFFTVSKKEIHVWTIKKNCTAYKAASVIHTDFKKGFIRAEIMHYNDFIKYGSFKKVKKAGKLLIKGKNYYIHDGDIIHFLFNI